MSFQSILARIRGKFRRTICRYCARREISVSSVRPIVSFTFDDFPASACNIGARILERYGCQGTYYTSLGLAGKVGPVGDFFRESDLLLLLERGHELGCHTFDHRHPWLTPSGDYERSIDRNRDELDRISPGASFTSHSYPFSYPRPSVKEICAKYFPCARGGGQKANSRLIDLNYVPAFFIEKSRDDLATVRGAIDCAKENCAWLIFATHDICVTPSPFGCSPEVFETIVRHTVEANISVLPVARALAALQVTPNAKRPD